MKKTNFIDESGIADLTDRKYKNFILTSAVVDNAELETVYGYFSLIKRKYGLPEEIPFHSYDLLENPTSKLSTKQAKLFIKSMCEFIELVPMTISAFHVKKESFINDFNITNEDLRGSKNNKEKRGLLYYLAAIGQMRLFIEDLNDSDSLGYIHADSRTYQDRDLLEAFLHIKQRKIKGNVDNTYYDEAKKRLVSITFADKSALSSGIQLADFASFIIFMHLERKMSSFNEIGLNNVWRNLKDKINIVNLVDYYGKEEIEKYL